jgi:hypothetical protein
MAYTDIALTDVEKLTKRAYHDKNIIRTFNYDRTLHALLDRRPQDVDQGGGFYYPFHIEGTASGGYIDETDTTPASQAQGRDWLYFTRMPQYVKRLALTTKAMHATGTRKAAVRRAAKTEMDGLVRDARVDMGIQVYTPHYGLLAKCTKPVSTTQFYVEFGAHRRLRVGQTVAVAKISDDSVTNGKASTTITDIDNKTGLITVGTALSGISWSRDQHGVSDHGVFHILSFTKWNAPHGLEEIISEVNPEGASSIDYGNVDRDVAGTGWAKGQVIDLEGGEIEHPVGDEACDMVSVQGNGEIDLFVTTPEILREIKKISIGTKRSPMRVKKASEWYTDTDFAGKPIIADRFCTPGCIYGIDRNMVWVAEEKKAGFESMDGSVWHLMESYLAYQAVFTRHHELVAAPNCHAVIKNVRSYAYSLGTAQV